MTDIPTLTHHTHCLDKRLVLVEERLVKLISLHDSMQRIVHANGLLEKRLEVFNNIEDRFKEIERYMKYMLNFFDPSPKMKRELDKLHKEIKAKDDELHTIKQNLKGILE